MRSKLHKMWDFSGLVSRSVLSALNRLEVIFVGYVLRAAFLYCCSYCPSCRALCYSIDLGNLSNLVINKEV